MLGSHLERRTARSERRIGLLDSPSPIKAWKGNMERKQFYLMHGDGTPSAMEYAAAVASDTAARLREKEDKVQAAVEKAKERLAQRKIAERASQPRALPTAAGSNTMMHVFMPTGPARAATERQGSTEEWGAAAVITEHCVEDEEQLASNYASSQSEDLGYAEPEDRCDLPCTYMSAGEAWGILQSYQQS
eukprot:TRINITY_DN27363_c0_g1_i1.p1 TRINITY_DN27363_c0_g1~~TRINITY_DN27363_c0_g1_i1.p1  ORF type:complete len:190 (+),score=27.20 TRINITY_DN27363_c0_g1_i1:98-667(+)